MKEDCFDPREDEELQRLRQAVVRSADQLVALLVRLIDLGRPGASDRGTRLATTAHELARRFEVPAKFLPDLELAARLHEIGLVVDRPGRPGLGAADADAWRYTVVSRAVLAEHDALREVADLVEAMRENWDGSGFPGRLQRGQIPFRSRILHVLFDFYALVDRAAADGRPISAEAAARELSAHAGTWYDPVIVTQLEATVSGSPGLGATATRMVLPVSELHAGMVLAEDLCTSSGIKLLARGTPLTRGTLDIILLRHQSDPIIAGAWVEHPAA